MNALPTSDMPGHRDLHEIVCSALDRCVESQGVEFKQSSPWGELKWHIIKTLAAMGNLRDGGIVILGASESAGTWSLTGVSPDHLQTYDVDVIADSVARFVSPPPAIEAVLVTHGAPRPFLALRVREFDFPPYVCTRDCPEQSPSFFAGDVFTRPLGKPQTKKVTSASEMQTLLELAAEKRVRRFLQTAHEVGLSAKNSAEELFVAELEGL